MYRTDITVGWLILFGCLALAMLVGAFVAVVQASIQRGALYRESMKRQQAEHERQLALEKLAVAEQTRRHISTELHGSVGQLQGLLTMNLKAMMRREIAAPIRKQLVVQADLADRVLMALRQLAHTIDGRPLVDKGLAAMIRELLGTSAYDNYTVTLDIADTLPKLESGRAMLAYRVVQEALANAIRHGEPAELLVGLAASGKELRLVVRDDGRGFDPNNPMHEVGMGLSNINEYATELGASLQIRSAPGEGTAVMMRIPTLHIS